MNEVSGADHRRALNMAWLYTAALVVALILMAGVLVLRTLAPDGRSQARTSEAPATPSLVAYPLPSPNLLSVPEATAPEGTPVPESGADERLPVRPGGVRLTAPDSLDTGVSRKERYMSVSPGAHLPVPAKSPGVGAPSGMSQEVGAAGPKRARPQARQAYDTWGTGY